MKNGHSFELMSGQRRGCTTAGGNKKNRQQQIGDGHVYDQKVDGFSHGFCLVDNYFDDGVPSQRNKKDQAVSRRFSDFFCSRIPVASRWLCHIHDFIHGVLRHTVVVQFLFLLFHSQMIFFSGLLT